MQKREKERVRHRSRGQFPGVLLKRNPHDEAVLNSGTDQNAKKKKQKKGVGGGKREIVDEAVQRSV